MRLTTAADQVGIGTATPNAKLDVRGSAIFNEDGGNFDFRIEGDANANLFFADASTDRIGIGNNAPTQPLHVTGNARITGDLLIDNTATITTGRLGAFANGTAAAPAYSFSGDPNTGIYTPGADQLSFSTAGTESVRILANGSVGIGNAAPTQPLHVTGNARITGDLLIDNTVTITTGRLGTFANGTAAAPAYSFSGDPNTGIYTPGADQLSFSTAGTESVRILANGSVGIGTNPAYRLDVGTDVANGYAANFFNDGNNANRWGIRIQAGADNAGGTTYYVRCYDGDASEEVGNLQQNGGNFSLQNVSDIRRKTNVKNTSLNGSDIVNKIRVVDYNMKNNPEGITHHGFIAQELNAVFPYMVSENEDGLLTINQVALIPVLIKAVQEQQKQIDDLKKLILEANNGNNAGRESESKGRSK